jgi:radical SAM protein with 4Fe4S-binding SPASM domain
MLLLVTTLLLLQKRNKMSHERKRTISFFVTTRCNLACSYCVNDIKKVKAHQDIDLQFAKKGLDDFFVKRKDLFGKGNNKIKFYAVGEPTTRMDLIKSITEYAHKLKGDDLFVELQTNGYFSKKKAEWIRDNVDEVWISLDGSPEIQNKNRPRKNGKPTSAVIEKNIESLLESTFVGIRATIAPEDAKKQSGMIDYFHSLGVRWVYAEPMFESVKQNGSSCDSSITSVNLEEFVEEFVKAYKYAKSKKVHYGNFFTVNFDEPCDYACRSCLPMPQLTSDGYVSGCDLAYSGSSSLSDFIFGKFDKEKGEILYSPEKIARIRERHVDNISECKECEVKSNCGGGCAGLAYYATGNFLQIVPEFCNAIKYLAKHIPLNQGCAEHLHP